MDTIDRSNITSSLSKLSVTPYIKDKFSMFYFSKPYINGGNINSYHFPNSWGNIERSLTEQI